MMRTFDHDGVALSYRDEGTGPALIFQHGLGAQAGQPFEVLGGLTGFRRITLECRAQGESALGPTESLSIATFANDVLALADHLGLSRFHLGGISMGAAISARLAARHSRRIQSLCLARPAWVSDAAPANMAIFAEAARFMAAHGREEGRARFQAAPAFAALQKTSPDNASSLLGQFDAPDLDVRAALLSAIATDGPEVTPAQLSELSMPTLVIGHDHDAVHPFAFAEELAALIPSADLATITPKSVSRKAYLTDFSQAIGSFFEAAERSEALVHG
ncbi:MAG: alpha/beta hydrolase [Pseudomonadota bacterium]